MPADCMTADERIDAWIEEELFGEDGMADACADVRRTRAEAVEAVSGGLADTRSDGRADG